MTKLLGVELKTNKDGKSIIDQSSADKLSINILNFALTDLPSIANASRVQKDWKRIIDEAFPVHLVHKTFPLLKILMAKKLGGGATNTTTFIQTSTDLLVGRNPGKDSDGFLNRAAESENIKIACKIGISPAVIYDDGQGVLLTKYLKNPKTMSAALFKKVDLLDKTIKTLKKVHDSHTRFANDIDIFERNDRMHEIITKRHFKLSCELEKIISETRELKKIFHEMEIKKVPCHVDTCPGNFVESEGEIKIIDWEYSGNNDPIWDLACLSVESEFSIEQDQQMFASYFDSAIDQEALQRFILYKPVYHCWVALWACVQLANRNLGYGENLLNEMVTFRIEKYKKSTKNPQFQETVVLFKEQFHNKKHLI